MDEKSTTNTTSATSKTPGTQRKRYDRKARKSTKQTLRVKPPMVRFNSQTQILELSRGFIHGGVEFEPKDPVGLSFAQMDEKTRQVAINVAKIVVTFANGGRPEQRRKVKTKDGADAETSLIDEFNKLVNRLYPESPEADQTPALQDEAKSNGVVQ